MISSSSWSCDAGMPPYCMSTSESALCHEAAENCHHCHIHPENMCGLPEKEKTLDSWILQTPPEMRKHGIIKIVCVGTFHAKWNAHKVFPATDALEELPTNTEGKNCIPTRVWGLGEELPTNTGLGEELPTNTGV